MLLSAGRVYYSQVLLLLGLPVYGLSTWCMGYKPSSSLFVRFISGAQGLIALNLWSGGPVEQLLQPNWLWVQVSPRSPPNLCKTVKRVSVTLSLITFFFFYALISSMWFKKGSSRQEIPNFHFPECVLFSSSCSYCLFEDGGRRALHHTVRGSAVCMEISCVITLSRVRAENEVEKKKSSTHCTETCTSWIFGSKENYKDIIGIKFR